MDFKQLSYDLKELDEAKGVVVAYANAYDFKDSDGDISAQGSFNKTVTENFKRIRVLKDHNPTKMIGVPLAIDTADSYGLLTTSKFNMNKPLAKDTFTDVKLMHDNGLNAELSIGYNVIARDKKNNSIITEYKLMEYSFLSSWAANELSTVQNIKGVRSHYGIMELIEKAYNLDYSDSRLAQIETLLKTLNNKEVLDISPQDIIMNFVKAGFKPSQQRDENGEWSSGGSDAETTLIQGQNFYEGDKFTVGDDSSIYTFINITKNERYGFQELNAENEFGSVSSFRIDNMVEHGLIISRVF